MKNVLFIIALFGLAACGADGPPVAKDNGVSVSGTASIGVSGNF